MKINILTRSTTVLVLAFAMVLFAILIEKKYSCAASETTHSSTSTTIKNEANGTVTEKTQKSESQEIPEKKEEGGHSLVGSFFVFIGNVVAFPFRLIGGVFDAIF